MNSSYRSILENSLEEFTEGVQVWKDLGDAEAETLQIAGAFIDRSRQNRSVSSTVSSSRVKGNR